MGRPLKFRAWDRFCGGYSKGTIRVSYGSDGKFSFEAGDRYTIEQFTGLRDKNGREIYEGDILRWVGMAFPVHVDDFHGIRFMWGKDQITKANAVDGEVIGNIHENADLLREEKK